VKQETSTEYTTRSEYNVIRKIYSRTYNILHAFQSRTQMNPTLSMKTTALYPSLLYPHVVNKGNWTLTAT